MKLKNFYSFCLILMALLCSGNVWGAAAYYSVDGIRYYGSNATTKSVQVTALSSGKYSGDISIPASFQYNSYTYTVMGIRADAFSGSTGVTSVTIAEGLTSIGDQAFMGCTSLTEITIPASVTSVGYRAFANCSSLTAVTFAGTTPPSISYLTNATWRFDYNSAIANIYVPEEAVDTYKTFWSALADKISAIPSAGDPDPCAAVSGVGFEEDFEDVEGDLPDCWQSINSVHMRSGGYYAHGGSKSLNLIGGNATNIPVAVLPAFNNTGDLYVKFYYKEDQVFEAFATPQVGYITDPTDASTFVMVKQLTKSASYTQAKVSMAGAPAGSYVAIRLAGGTTVTDLYVDDIEITEQPSCTVPTSVSGVATSQTAANISWTKSTESSWLLVYSSDNGTTWSDEIAVAAGDLVDGKYPLTGLESGTSYIVKVKSDCGEDIYSDWSAASPAFKTPCYAMSIAAFDGTFEAETAGSGLMPNCWDAVSYTYSNVTYPYVRAGYSANNGDNWLHFYGGTNSTKNIAILPLFTEALNTLTISFYYKNYNTYSGQFSVGYYKNGEFTAYEGAANLERKTTYTYFEMAIPNIADAEGARLAIQYAGGSYSYDAYIDDVVISLTPSCAKPSGITVSNIVYDGATIDWTENGSAEAWKVEYSTDNTNWTTANGGENVTAHPYELRGLTTGTPYYVHVIAVCGPTDESPAVAAASTFTPECKRPGTPTIPAKTTTTATIQWTVNSGEDEWNLQYKKPADSEWSDAIHVTTNPYTLTGLESGTTYRVHVTAGCKEDYSAAAEFETECEAKTLPYNWGFDALTCWTLESCNEYSGLNSGAFRFRWTTTPPQYLISPELVASDKQVDVAFDYKVESSGNPETFIVGYSTSTKDLAAFTWGEAHTYSNTSYANYSERLPIGVKYIAIQCTSNNKYYLYIDNFTVTEYIAPSCAAPTALAVSEVSTNSAKVTWESEATEFALQYKKTSDADWTAATGTIASPFVLDGLTANETEYTVRLKAICGVGNESDWVELALPFKTDCEAKTLGWSEDFDGLTALPTCWAASAYGSGNGQWYMYNNEARFNARSNNNADLTTPDITLSEAAQLQFTHTNSLTTGSVYVKEGVNDPVLLANISTASSAKLEKYNLTDYTGKTVKIIFRGHGYNAYTSTYFYLEDVAIVAKPCAVPTITAANATSTGAIITWTPGDDESQWNLQYREVAEPENSWIPVNDVTSGYEITGLEVGHNYEVQVQAYCDATHQSAWTASTNFSPICGAAPTNLTVSARTTNSATLTWNGVEEAFKLQTSLDGDTWEDAIDVNAKTYNLTSLSAGQTYYARVQNACGGDYTTVSFKTWCGFQDAASLPLNVEIFTAVPECWEATFKGTNSGVAGSKICFYGTEEQSVVLPAYDIDLNKLSATFTYSMNGATVDFGYIDAPNGEFHAFASQPTSGVELDLAAEAAAPKYIAVRYNGGSSNYSSVMISSVLVRKTPTCLKPTGVAGTPGVGAATISWTENGSAEAWNLQYKTGSNDWTTVPVTENPYNLSSLEQGVTYKVRVQAACAGEDPSDWSDEAQFLTNCEGVALPWDADFSQALSACWTIYAQDETYYKPAANTIQQDLQISGGKNGASNNVVVLPAFSASLTDAMLTFEYRGSTGSNYAQLEAGYVTDKADATTFVALETLAQAASYTEARIALNTVPADAYLAFRYAGGASHGDQYIRNLRVANTAVLADNVNNTATLAALNGQTLDVVIGRTFVCADYFNTICLPFSLSAAELAASPIASNDIWAFKYARVESGELLIRITETESINAGEPYLISWPAGDNIVAPLFKNVTISASVGQTMGEDNLKFVGTLKPETFAEHDDSKLFLYQNNTLYWWDGDAASSMNSFRAFFTVEGGADTMPIKHLPARIIREDQNATGVEGVQPAAISTQKILENDHVVIIRDGIRYNVMGVKIQ